MFFTGSVFGSIFWRFHAILTDFWTLGTSKIMVFGWEVLHFLENNVFPSRSRSGSDFSGFCSFFGRFRSLFSPFWRPKNLFATFWRFFLGVLKIVVFRVGFFKGPGRAPRVENGARRLLKMERNRDKMRRIRRNPKKVISEKCNTSQLKIMFLGVPRVQKSVKIAENREKDAVKKRPGQSVWKFVFSTDFRRFWCKKGGV